MTRKRSHRSAFTLIEVLLTSVLAATLLAALWTLLGMYLKIFDTGQTKTEQSQLARTLLAQISDDLHSVVQAPPLAPPLPLLVSAIPTAPSAPLPGNSTSGPSASPTTATPANSSASGGNNAPPGALAAATTSGAAAAPSGNSPQAGSASSVTVTSSLRPAGLFGTENYLQIDVWRPTDVPAEVEARERRAPGEPLGSRAAELRTVIYSFEEIPQPAHPLGEPRACLTRRELDWEQAHPAPRGGAGGSRFAARRFGAGSEPTEGAASAGATERDGRKGLEITDEIRDDPAKTNVPEVVQLGIRYFDGASWTTEWDSVARKGLPAAVEVAMQLRSFDEPESQPTAHHPANEAPAEDPRVKLARAPVYRLTIHLASAQPAGGQALSKMGRPAVPDAPGPRSTRDAEPPLRPDHHGGFR